MFTITQGALKKKTITVDEAATLLGIGRTAAYQAVSTGQIPSLRIGRRIVVPVAQLAKLLGEDTASVVTIAGEADIQ